LSTWDTSNVTDMYNVFYNAESFNQPLNSWNVENVTNMGNMFTGAKIFNQPLDSWDVSKVTNMYSMFEQAENFNQSLSTWDVSIIINMFQFLSQSGMSVTNYSDTLIAWSNLTLLNKVRMDAGGVKYNAAGEIARTNIINIYEWQINDSGLE